MVTKRVSEDELRRMFNEGRYYERMKSGEFREKARLRTTLTTMETASRGFINFAGAMALSEDPANLTQRPCSTMASSMPSRLASNGIYQGGMRIDVNQVVPR
jgi:hypothetical protein